MDEVPAAAAATTTAASRSNHTASAPHAEGHANCPSDHRTSDESSTFQRMVLYCMPPFSDPSTSSWRLPAIAPQELVVQIYMKMTFCTTFQLKYTASTDLSPNGKLPVLEHGENWVGGMMEIIEYLENQGFVLGMGMSKLDHILVQSLTAQTAQAFNAYLEYELWQNPENFFKLTRPAYGNGYRFPLSLILPTTTYLEKRFFQSREYTPTVIEEIKEELLSCLRSLSSILGRKKTFYDVGFTKLDAVVAGYMAFAQYLPLRDPWLRATVVCSHMNLLNVCDSVLEGFLHIHAPALTLRVPELEFVEPGSWEKSKPLIYAAGAVSVGVALHWFMSNRVYANVIQPSVVRALRSLGVSTPPSARSLNIKIEFS